MSSSIIYFDMKDVQSMIDSPTFAASTDINFRTSLTYHTQNIIIIIITYHITYRMRSVPVAVPYLSTGV